MRRFVQHLLAWQPKCSASGTGCSLRGMSSETVPKALALDETNAPLFWCDIWATGQTRWKSWEESSHFSRNVFASLQQGPAEALGALGISVDSDRDKTVASCVKGRSVFVPLCGDTGALRFFVDNGAREVYGVEFVRDAVDRSIAQWFPASDGWSFAAADSSVPGITVLVGTSSSAGASKVTFMVGDLFLAAPLLKGLIDIVYDRASMVAMHPASRRQYASALASSFRVTGPGLLFLQRVERPPEGATEGPPFHLPTQAVREAYAAEGFRVEPYWEVQVEGDPPTPNFQFVYSAAAVRGPPVQH